MSDLTLQQHGEVQVPDTEASIDNARLFLSIPIPAATRTKLRQALKPFSPYIEQVVPESKWHITLLFLGNVEHHEQYLKRLSRDLPQAYLPTLTLTYVGRGLHRKQLWAYAHPSTMLLNIREQMLDRLRKMRFPFPRPENQDYIPHIHLANLWPMARGIGIADHTCATTFAIRELELWRSHLTTQGSYYQHESSISLAT